MAYTTLSLKLYQILPNSYLKVGTITVVNYINYLYLFDNF
jgi:hypothetical protein